jgi:surfeit locus 1 family protein
MTRKTAIELVFVLGGAAILMMLGSWQLERLAWKENIIKTLQQGYESINSGASKTLTADDLDSLSQEPSPLKVGKVTGRLLRDKSILMGPRTEDGRAGFHLLIPLEISANHTLLINTGWVSDLWHDTLEERLAAMPQQDFTIQGIFRKPDWNRFSSANSPENNIWFRPDLEEIQKAKDIDTLYPFILYATDIAPPLSEDMVFHKQDWFPRNNHGQYAAFWFSMAVMLIGFYITLKWLSLKAAKPVLSARTTED